MGAYGHPTFLTGMACPYAQVTNNDRCHLGVLAIDKEPEAIALLERRVGHEHRALLQTRIAALEELDLPPLDLVLACFSLPFCNQEYFPGLWKIITNSLTPGGVFAGRPGRHRRCGPVGSSPTRWSRRAALRP